MTFTVNPLAIGGEQGYRGLNPNLNPNKIEEFISPAQTLTSGGNLSLPHGLSKKPTIIQAFAVCVSAEDNYVAGDELEIPIYPQSSAADADRGIACVADESTLEITFGSNVNSIMLINKSTGAAASTTNTSWKIYFKAYAITIGDVPDITRVGLVALENIRLANGQADQEFDLAQYANEYGSFEFKMYQLKNATDATSIHAVVSFDGGATYQTTTYNNTYSGVSGGAASNSESSSQAAIIFGSTGTASASEKLNGYIIFDHPDEPAGIHQWHFLYHGRSSSGNDLTIKGNGFCSNVQDTPLTNVKFIPSSGNFAEGIITLYGYRKVT